MSTPREDRDRQTRRRIAELSEDWRRTAAALPFWHLDDTGPELVLIGNDFNEPVATLHGRWAPNLARFLTAMDKTAGVYLADLLWRVSAGGSDGNLTKASIQLFQAMGLEERVERHRPL
ncbi:hypothetical protein [Amycolatopsis lexingtonensis]|uniref:hypothetical protein n=1 Tax=Amycolatopsis lexingtonensis TaxID=218822 RepID=UPI003F7150B8